MDEQPSLAPEEGQKPTKDARRAGRVTIIDTVQTPLGFFVLVVLVVEMILGVVTTTTTGSAQTYLVVGMLGLIFLLVLLVPLMAILFPHALYGHDEPADSEAPTPPGSRLAALDNSKWQVDIGQVEGPDGQPYKQTLRTKLRVKGTAIQGEFVDVDAGLGCREPFVISGRLYFERFLQLDCHPKKPGSVQFSTWLLEWHDRPTVLEGRFVGYGQFTGKIIHGTVTLTKVN